MKTIKALYIEETKSYMVKLPNGVYKIDGEIFTSDENQEIALKSLDNIFLLTMQSKIIYYVNAEDKILSIDEYEKEIQKLKSKGEYLDYEWVFDNLDDEFNYRKFIRQWTPISKRIVVVEENVVFETETIKITIENSNILPIYTVTGELSGVYIYKQSAARMSIFRDLVKELKLVESDDIRSDSYSLPTHSGLTYAKICGHYVFNDKKLWSDNITDKRGSLEYLKNLYAEDLETITSRVKSKYNIVNGKSNSNLLFFEKDLRSLQIYLNAIDSKQKTISEWHNAIRLIKKILNKFYSETSK